MQPDDAIPLDAVGAVGPPQDELDSELYDFAAQLQRAKKKKKRRKPVEAEGKDAEEKEEDRYSYAFLLARIEQLLAAQNPALRETRKYTLAPPRVCAAGSKKMVWTNFRDACATLGRDPAHLCAFFSAELGSDATVDAQGRLAIKGRFRGADAKLQSLLRAYIAAYVCCGSCKLPETALERDPATRLYAIRCKLCRAQRVAQPIRKLYHAQTRADRRAAAQRDA